MGPLDPAAAPDDIALSERADLERFDPQWCIFWPGSVSDSQFAIWSPYLERSRYRWLVVARSGSASDQVRAAIARMPNVRLLLASDQRIRWLTTCRSFQGFLYVLGFKPATFANVNTFRSAAHVWIGHGDSEKRSSSPRTASLYDAVFVADYRAIRRFPRAIRSWVARGACAIGAPIVDGVEADPAPGPRPVRTILYAPTWEGYSPSTEYASILEAAPRLASLMPQFQADGVRVIVRPHPLTGRRVPAYGQAVHDLLAAGAEPGGDKAADFAAADVIVSDVSGVTSEWLFTRKPAILPVSRRLSQTGKRPDVLRTDYPWMYQWDTDAQPLSDLLSLIEERDPLRSARAARAKAMYRGHRTLDEAVRSFDQALSVVWFRKTPIPVRWAYEVQRRFGHVPDFAAADRWFRRSRSG